MLLLFYLFIYLFFADYMLRMCEKWTDDSYRRQWGCGFILVHRQQWTGIYLFIN